MEIIGYKCFNKDLTNRYGRKMNVGEKYTANGAVNFGNVGHGFHFCKNIEGLPEDAIEVRSVGAASETTTDKQSLMASSSEYNEVGLKGDENFEQDVIRMFCFGVVTTGEEYWVASRLVDSDLYDDFMVRCVGAEGYLEYDVLWRITSTGHATGFNGSRRVRPVITIEKP